jgi:hypothetical protein
MLSFGFSTRHWQQVEAGRPITVTTFLRICEVFELPMSKLVQGLDAEGVARLPEFMSPWLCSRYKALSTRCSVFVCFAAVLMPPAISENNYVFSLRMQKIKSAFSPR